MHGHHLDITKPDCMLTEQSQVIVGKLNGGEWRLVQVELTYHSVSIFHFSPSDDEKYIDHALMPS